MSRWTWGVRLIVILWAALGLGAMPAQAENYAFLVAVQDYDVKDLKKLNYTRNDIEQFAALLKESGFKAENIVLMTDNTKIRNGPNSSLSAKSMTGSKSVPPSGSCCWWMPAATIRSAQSRRAATP